MDNAPRPAHRTSPVGLPKAAAGLAETWSPRVAGRINDVLVKVVRLDGDFVWHHHPDTDEAFLCLGGRLVLDLRDGDPEQQRSVELTEGDLYVVPRGVQHCPHAPEGATVAVFEAAGVVNTGDAGGALTAPVDREPDDGVRALSGGPDRGEGPYGGDPGLRARGRPQPSSAAAMRSRSARNWASRCSGTASVIRRSMA